MLGCDLSIIIVNWNTRELLRRCLESIAGSRAASPGLKMQVLVVDNASSDGSQDMVRSAFPWVMLLENRENLGFARANNCGMRVASGRYLLILNSDTELQENALDSLVAFADAHPQAGAVGPRLLNPDGSLQPSCYPVLTPGREFWRLLFLDRVCRRATYPMQAWDPGVPRRVDVIMGACLLLKRAALSEVGLLDEQYFMYSEEMDLCHRLAQAGWESWWVPKASVLHHGAGSSSRAAEAMYVQLYRSKVQFYRKFGGARAADRFKQFLRLAYGPRLALAWAGGLASRTLRARACTYRRLLAELSDM